MKYLFVLLTCISIQVFSLQQDECNARIFYDEADYLIIEMPDGHSFYIDTMVHWWMCDCDYYMD